MERAVDVLLHGSYRQRVYVFAATNTGRSGLPAVLELKVASFIMTEPVIPCCVPEVATGLRRGADDGRGTDIN
jgi:hypothetical protein